MLKIELAKKQTEATRIIEAPLVRLSLKLKTSPAAQKSADSAQLIAIIEPRLFEIFSAMKGGIVISEITKISPTI